MLHRCLAVAVVVVGMFPAASGAAPLVSWNLSGVAGDVASVAPTFQAPGVAGLNITRGTGLVGNTSSNSFNSRGWDDLGANDFVQLGFTVTSGPPISLDTLTIATQSSGTGPGFVNVNVSLDGGAFFTLTTLTQGNGTQLNSILNLAGYTVASSLVIQFRAANDQDANPPGTIAATGTFRLAENNSSGTFVDVTLSGFRQENPAPAAVPEPAGSASPSGDGGWAERAKPPFPLLGGGPILNECP
jgi:hypothetical protein